jgi:hypothetical protein
MTRLGERIGEVREEPLQPMPIIAVPIIVREPVPIRVSVPAMPAQPATRQAS